MDDVDNIVCCQAYMQLNELLPALNAAMRAVELNALWWTAHQTLGRTHLGLGEVRMVTKQLKSVAVLSVNTV